MKTTYSKKVPRRDQFSEVLSYWAEIWKFCDIYYNVNARYKGFAHHDTLNSAIPEQSEASL